MKLSDFVTTIKPLNRRGLFSHWTAKVGDMRVTGTSQDEATTDLLHSIELAVTGSYEPAVFFNVDRTYYALCYRTVDAWCYAIAPVGQGIGNVCWHVLGPSREECIQHAKSHLQDYAGVL